MKFWRWMFHYKVMFVTLDKNFTVEHRFGRRPIMTSSKNPEGLRGRSLSIVYIDESQTLTVEEVENLTKVVDKTINQ